MTICKQCGKPQSDVDAALGIACQCGCNDYIVIPNVTLGERLADVYMQYGEWDKARDSIVSECVNDSERVLNLAYVRARELATKDLMSWIDDSVDGRIDVQSARDRLNVDYDSYTVDWLLSTSRLIEVNDGYVTSKKR